MTVKKLKSAILMLAAAATIAVSAVAPAAANSVNPPASAVAELRQNAAHVAEFFRLQNAERAKVGAPALKFVPSLSASISQTHSAKMAATNGDPYHQTHKALIVPGGSGIGENIYRGLAAAPNPPKVTINAFMGSPGHKKALLDAKFTHVGIGWSVSKQGRSYVTVNFWGGNPTNVGSKYSTKAEVLSALTKLPNGQATGAAIYTTPGYHTTGGRDWFTRCEPYSGTIERCWTSILTGGQWVHNNLTYTPAPRSSWVGNPLGGYGQYGYSGQWTSSGRQWRVECDTPATGRGACRAYMLVNGAWVINNIVLFTN